jgi:hypothetical protein
VRHERRADLVARALQERERAGREPEAATARSIGAATSADVPAFDGCAFATTGQPAASADAVSPPATPNASGKFDAPNTATGPSGTIVRRRSGRGGVAVGSARSMIDVELRALAHDARERAQLSGGAHELAGEADRSERRLEVGARDERRPPHRARPRSHRAAPHARTGQRGERGCGGDRRATAAVDRSGVRLDERGLERLAGARVVRGERVGITCRLLCGSGRAAQSRPSGTGCSTGRRSSVPASAGGRPVRTVMSRRRSPRTCGLAVSHPAPGGELHAAEVVRAPALDRLVDGREGDLLAAAHDRLRA